MGKGTDKMYITHSEWSNEFSEGGMIFGGAGGRRNTQIFRRLPFDCCSLSMQPFEHPFCTEDGIIFDLVNIVPYLKKFGTNPATGEKLDAKSLIKLNFFKNANDEYHCPITLRVFNENTHIVAIKTSGNVYAYEAVERLNIKAKLWKDLMTDEPFTRKDIITIQDPHNLKNKNLAEFHHVKNDLVAVDEVAERKKRDPLNNINQMGSTAKVLNQLNMEKIEKAAVVRKKKEEEAKAQGNSSNKAMEAMANKAALPYNASVYSTGKTSSSLTSTAVSVATSNDRWLMTHEEYMFPLIKQKGYGTIVTNFGKINIELFCDQTPRTCYNFIMLAKSGYYKNVKFHRKIKNFMLQGGDPTGTGRGGESYWKENFKDEIKSKLSHNARGILSMANKGPGTNSSQFFITFKPCTHLDGKHTIFGKVVGGMDVLDKLEAVPADEDTDVPISPGIVMQDATIFVDPYQTFTERQKRKRKYEEEEKTNPVKKENPLDHSTWFGPTIKRDVEGGGTVGGGVGKYLAAATASKDSGETNKTGEASDVPAEPTRKKKTVAKGFGDFSSW
ncbi:Peptidyl-prolyl cis-trans isomerase cyp8 [Dissophora globulifera]|uniref:Peptidyl-prolyl cis-trans isomerase cyp8 n=1 Tax=Dissophora globulifera TaxID=979702 RepID=A0A9P6RV48_9FUNG|nr:Peptidyl-prolyl cis-trans isomerase cyp8 [Dissophora globulifera]